MLKPNINTQLRALVFIRVLTFILALNGCVSQQGLKKNTTYEQFLTDRYACIKEAKTGGKVDSDVYKNCMMLNGYSLNDDGYKVPDTMKILMFPGPIFY